MAGETELELLPHVAILSSPGMGLLIPLAQLAKRIVLHHHFSATFITHGHTKDSLQKTQKTILNTLPKSVQTISLPPVAPQNIPQGAKSATLISITHKCSIPSLRHVLKNLASTHRLVALVVDLFGTDAFDVAREVGVPPYLLYTSNFLSLSVDIHLPTVDSTLSSEPLKLPGCRPIPREDLVDAAQDRSNQAYTWFLHHGSRFKQAKGILVNSITELEPETLMGLRDEPSHPPIYTIGPLVQSSSTGMADVPKPNWLRWLDDQPRRSVLFVSFGSRGSLSFEQTKELALGLVMSQQRFLWVVRSPNDKEASASNQEPLDFLPDGFLERTKGVGHVVPLWVPQIEVLSHESTGGFLSHCGWNSTLESMVHGVPMIAWPLYAEQRTNALLLVEDLKVAVRPSADDSGVVKRDKIAKVVRALMDGGDEGQRVKRMMMEVKEASIKAMATEEGSSYRAMSEVLSEWNRYML
ncbi:hypothetical protein MRB53_000101 [Persea americana]|uniref:Uncharacterized protein n=1 Tax=Persea americana TaxID=3435 RepID=A0ACC2MN78_PERAE|nr:hypothetical protein MRB53_000101 [Persea americana]